MIDPPQVRPEEPTAVTPHGGICGGESQQWLSYPTNPHVRFDERDVKRSQGRTGEAPPDERGGNRYARPTAAAPHPHSTRLLIPICSRKRNKARQVDGAALTFALNSLDGCCVQNGNRNAPKRQQVRAWPAGRDAAYCVPQAVSVTCYSGARVVMV